MEQLVARQAHNLEVARSNPASATSKNATAFFFRFKAVSERAPGRRSSQSEASLRAERESCLRNYKEDASLNGLHFLFGARTITCFQSTFFAERS